MCFQIARLESECYKSRLGVSLKHFSIYIKARLQIHFFQMCEKNNIAVTHTTSRTDSWKSEWVNKTDLWLLPNFFLRFMTDMDGACVAQIRIISQSRLHPRESPGMPVIIFLSGSASSLFTGPWNALTLLHMQPIADTDKDGLPSQTGLKNGKKSKEKNQQPPQLSLSVSLSLSPPPSLSLSLSLHLSLPPSL